MDSIRVLREVSEQDGVESRIADVLQEAIHLVGEDLQFLEEDLLAACRNAPGKLSEICCHIVESGGKHIRPILCLLSFKACGGTGPLPIDLAATCELLHNATLLHDDVIDEGDSRRGRPSARMRFSNALSVLGGDYLLVKTVEKVASRDAIFMKHYLWTMEQIVGGELVQLLRRGSIDTTEEEYFKIIEGKTASLFRWSVLSGALAAGADEADCNTVAEFGRSVGMAFQLMDDILDFTADPKILGKSLLADIREGKMTLPVILAARKSSEIKPLLHKLSETDDPHRRQAAAVRISEVVRSLGTADTVKSIAVKHTEAGLKALPTLRTADKNVVRVIEDLAAALLRRDF